MTKRQTFAIFCKTKIDVRACNPTEKEIDLAFSLNNSDCFNLVKDWPGAIVKGTAVKDKQDWQKLYDLAREEGFKAVEACQVVPMVVQEHTNPLDDNSPVKKSYFVSDGVCGFAEIVISPGTCSFAKWLTKNNLARKHYYGGVSIWVGEFNQSMQRKETYAHAFANILNKNGVKAYATSRMD